MEVVTDSENTGIFPAHCTRAEIRFLFSNIFAQAPMGLAVMTIDEGRLYEANQTFLDQIEFEREAAIGYTTQELGIWPDVILRDKRARNIRKHGGEKGKEITIRCKSGTFKNILVSSQYILIDNEPCVLGVGVDITQRKIAELELEQAKQQAESASRAKSEFLMTVSHEIRTPLTAILSLSELLNEKVKSSGLKDDDRETVERIQKNTTFVIDLVNAILDLSKIEAEKLQINKSVFEVGTFLAESLESLKCLAEIKNLHFDLDLTSLGVVRIYSDPLRLQQIVTNIVGNAIKFTAQGHVSVRAHLLGLAPQTALEILVTDSGCGIPDAKRNLLFQSFAQVDSFANRRHTGTGLGLHLSRRLAILLGGDVHLVESHEQEGSTFSIIVEATLPQPTLVQAQPSEASTEPAIPISHKSKALKILLIEDNLDIQFAVKEILTFEGHHVDVASDGRAGISLILSQPYDTVLMDMHMPDLNGIEATKALRQIGYQGRIIAFSAAIQKEDRERAQKAGCDGFLKKPFEIEDLLKILKPTDS